jgi:hypothetical protein
VPGEAGTGFAGTDRNVTASVVIEQNKEAALVSGSFSF